MHVLPLLLAERLVAHRRDQLPNRCDHLREARLVAALARARPPNRVPRGWRRRYL
ncbi:MAG: hypothetical protein ACYCUG_02305 [Acidimicrobiales bacterium]